MPILILGPLMALGCVTTIPAPTPRVTTATGFNPANYTTLGIYLQNLSGQQLEEGVLREVEDEFMRSILERGFALAARSDIDRVVRELRLQSSGITEEAIARVGRVLNVPAIMLVSVTRVVTVDRDPPAFYNPSMRYYRTTIAISARLIGAEQADVLWISSLTDDWNSNSSAGNPRETWGSALQYVSGVVASGLPPRRSIP